MKLAYLPWRQLAVASLGLALSCSESTGPTAPESREPTDLRLLSVPVGAPPLAATRASFYAVKGKSAGADIWYHAQPGASDSSKFIEFRMGASALDRRPDGSTVTAGDSVLITLTVTDPTHLMIDFQPSGLRFSASDMPTLRMFFVACGDDLNYDGRIDSYDQSIVQSLNIWRQETPFQPWFKVTSTVVTGTKEVDAQLGGFTGYAIEY